LGRCRHNQFNCVIKIVSTGSETSGQRQDAKDMLWQLPGPDFGLWRMASCVHLNSPGML
jgi:hypothetical protein